MAQRPQQPQQNQLSCRRCNLVFPTWEARRRHIRESINHNVCYLCHSIVRDFETFNALQDHLDSFHFYCEPCDFFAPSVQGLMQHNLSVHNMCGVCREYFRNIHELNGHTVAVHRPHSANCLLCSRTFTALASVFNHLESGNCPQRATVQDIENLTREFYQSRGVPTYKLFACRECPRSFGRLSDLMQHIDTRACPATYWRGTASVGNLVEYLRRNLRRAVDVRLAAEQQQEQQQEQQPNQQPEQQPEQQQQQAENAPAQLTTTTTTTQPEAGDNNQQPNEANQPNEDPQPNGAHQPNENQNH
ncbi:hypothetical protein M432DRAFT_582305 [Thermoascus aurantiacus ATCC 26904]